MNSRDDLVLRTAQIQWVEGKNNNQWDVKDSNNKSLNLMLPADMDKNIIAELLLFMQKYEMKAFNEGEAQGKQAMMAAGAFRMKEYKDKIVLLEYLNEELANKIEVIIEGN